MPVKKKAKAKEKERRRKSRWNVAVLVRCSIPKLGDEPLDLEMWARDVNEGGLKLELTKGLSITRASEFENKSDGRHAPRFEDIEFSKGLKVKLQDLFYDDEGSPFIEGVISWASRSAGSWTIGLEFADKKKQSKEFLDAFKDFLKIVKNPSIAIEKASRKN